MFHRASRIWDGFGGDTGGERLGARQEFIQGFVGTGPAGYALGDDAHGELFQGSVLGDDIPQGTHLKVYFKG